jgi:tetratricopeptide (TPR) repeat protein
VFTLHDVRADLWKMALAQHKLNPVFGTGSETYQYYSRQFRPAFIVADPVHAHNDYLQFLAEYGIIGMVLLAVFVGCHLWFGYKALNYFVTERPVARYRMQSDSLALNIGALSATAIYVVHSFLDFNLHIPANAILLAFALGTLANPGIFMPQVNATHEKISHYLKLCLPVVGLWIAACGLPKLPAEYFAEQARVALTKERYREAISLAELGLPGDRKNPFLSLYLAQGHAGIAENTTNAAVAEASFKAAVTSFQHGLELYPREQWLLIGVASALDGLNRFDEARRYYDEAVKWNPNSPQIYNYYATHLRLSGKLDEAEAMYNRSIKLFWTPAAVAGLEMLAQARQAQQARR